jgi:hypothetical protein
VFNIYEFREVVCTAFLDEGLEEISLVKGGSDVRALTREYVIRFFTPHALRRP